MREKPVSVFLAAILTAPAAISRARFSLTGARRPVRDNGLTPRAMGVWFARADRACHAFTALNIATTLLRMACRANEFQLLQSESADQASVLVAAISALSHASSPVSRRSSRMSAVLLRGRLIDPSPFL